MYNTSEEKAYRKGLSDGALALAKICSIFENGSFEEIMGLLNYVNKSNVEIDKKKTEDLVR